MTRRKRIVFVGRSLEDLKDFPEAARTEAGHQLDQVQQGLDPDDFKPMHTVGRGTYEVRISREGRAHRVFYVAKFEEAVYVLHAFEKKSRKTSKRDLETGRRRYKDMMEIRP